MEKTKNTQRIIKYIGVLLTASIYLLIFSLNTSPLYDWQVGDATIFRMLGVLAHRGMVPYTEFFDHKGPFIILVEYLGACISHKPFGNLIVQIPFTFFSFLGIKRIVDYFAYNTKSVKILVYIVSLLIYIIYIPNNLTEEYCMPFLIWSCFFAIRYISEKESKHNLWWSFLYGITIMVCVLTRITNVIPLAGMLLVGMIVMIKRKDHFFKNLLVIIGGMAVFALPFIIYFVVHNAFYDMFYASIIYNFKYAANIGTNFSVTLLLNILVRKLLLVVFAMIVSIMSIMTKKNKELSYAVLISSVLAIILQLTSNLGFTQYLAVQVPIIVIAICLLAKLESNKIFVKVVAYCVIIIGAILLVLNIGLKAKDLLKVRHNDASYQLKKESEEIVKKIDRDANVIAYNVDSYFYIVSGINPCYKYCILQDWQSKLDKEMQKEIIKDFKSLKAEYVVEDIAKGRYDSVIDKHYKEVYRTKQLKLLKRK